MVSGMLRHMRSVCLPDISDISDISDMAEFLTSFERALCDLHIYVTLGVPGMVGGMLRHMRSLRSMSRDNGWIHTLLEEAENERMHLLTFLQLRQPGLMFRGMVLLSQVWELS